MARYPNVSVDGGPEQSVYLEMDGIEELAEWSVRYETGVSDEMARLFLIETDQVHRAVKARVDICPGVAFESYVHVYLRPGSDPVSGLPIVDVTLTGTGELTACQS